MVDRKLKAAKGAFDVSLDNGIDFFDTAEVYGSKVKNEKPLCSLPFSVTWFCFKDRCGISHSCFH